MILSIIIAAYNIEKYIKDCIISCVRQDIPIDDYEILIVNDGSTDNTREIALELSQVYCNIKILDKENGGLSSARNTGLIHASGEYVWFVDGDDRIKENCLGELMRLISRDKLDCYMVNYSTFDLINEISEKQLSGYPTLSFNPTDYIKSKETILPMMAWLTIASKDFLKRNNLMFTVNIIHEDFDFSVREMSLCKRLLFIDSPLYLYRINRFGSIMNKNNRFRSLKSLCSIYDVWKQFFALYETDPIHERIAMSVLSGFIYFSAIYNKLDIPEKNKFSKELKDRIWNGAPKQRIKLVIYKFFPNILFYKLFPVYN